MNVVSRNIKLNFFSSAIKCSTTNLQNVTNGHFKECDHNSDVSIGTECTLECDEGFYPADSTKIVCEAGTTNQEGKWSNGSFVCLGVNCQTILYSLVTERTIQGLGRELTILIPIRRIGIYFS